MQADMKLFTRQHYEAHRGLAPAPLCELVVHCLELVAELSRHGLLYRFKGGNSLLVLLEAPERFSIDVDIVTTEPKDKLTALVEQIVSSKGSVFTRWEARAPKTKPWLPLVSYKLYFRSAFAEGPEAVTDQPYVMLDAVLTPPVYPGVVRPVRCGSLYVSDAEVEVPSISGLIADKLLAIGPSTLGIPVGRGKEAQRLKHVFDVSLLLRHPIDQAVVSAALLACQKQEEAIQGRSFSWAAIRDDTLEFCRVAAAHPAPPDPRTLAPLSYLQEIVVGFESFRQHLFRARYDWTDLLSDMARVSRFIETFP